MKSLNRFLCLLSIACGTLTSGFALLHAQDTDTVANVNVGTNSVPVGDATNFAATNVENAEASPSEKSEESQHNDLLGSKKKGVHRQPIVLFRKNALLKATDSTDQVVVIGGSATIHGHVNQNVVVIGGDIDIDGSAHDVVAILGGIKAGKGARVRDHVVAIGGSLDLEDGVTLNKEPFELDFHSLPIGLQKWVTQCVFKARPLALQVGWVWVVAGCFFAIYLVIALALPRAVRVCANELANRPVTTFFMGLITKILVPIIIIILCATGVGALVVPFIGAALLFGAMIGKTALFEAIGVGLGNRFGGGLHEHRLAAFLLGIALITALYMVPIMGLLALGVVSVWGLGGAITAGFGAFRREAPQGQRAVTPQPPPPPTTPIPPAPEGPVAPEAIPSTSPLGATSATQTSIQHLPEALANRRATFWERMGAAFLDIVVIGIICACIRCRPPLPFLIALVYFSAMWAWKGTTLGGIVLGLKVVRLDGQKLSPVAALVRSLTSALSIIVLFLGFLWIAWDSEKQGWHDKIAGTTVIRLPRSVPLVCL